MDRWGLNTSVLKEEEFIANLGEYIKSFLGAEYRYNRKIGHCQEFT